ncbi:hypothetical protein R5W24_003789 [Gemmata sp. JC717]|uniref:hypothetical protein n=1 Tax=Gemmata algarum TaxID=2975278 RepID=UPI0021BB034B|nr:hypothetical protein [Gemmata algarum]MDY3554663.1 hypothetical protein [Gemmata algarum]
MSAFDDEFGPPERPVAALKRVARYQRWLIAVVLGQLILWAGLVAWTLVSQRDLNVPLLKTLTLILGAVGAVFVFLLSWELKGPFAAVVFAAVTILPCAGFIVLMLVSGYASSELKRNGVKVGIFDTSGSSITDRPSLYDDEGAGW